MRTLIPLVLFLAISFQASADDCATWWSTEPELDTGIVPVGPRYYWEYDPCQPCMWSTYVYEESNGIDGLQRKDEVYDTTCHDMIPADTIVI